MAGKKDSHFVSVVIPTIGRETIKHTKKALNSQTRKPDEVIVILNKNMAGVSWARNQGIKKAKGDLIAFTDDDCIPPKDWIERLVKAIDKYGAAGAGGTYKEADQLFKDIDNYKREYPSKEEIDLTGIVGTGGNVMYKKSWLMKLFKDDSYFFNESMVICEDHEISWRMRQKGAKIIFVPNPVKHLRQVNLVKHLRRQFLMGIGISSLYKIHKKAKGNELIQKSLLWDKEGKKVNLPKIIWKKVIGPFGIKKFKNTKNFFAFWLGEKAEGLGFAYGMLNKNAGKGKWA